MRRISSPTAEMHTEIIIRRLKLALPMIVNTPSPSLVLSLPRYNQASRVARRISGALLPKITMGVKPAKFYTEPQYTSRKVRFSMLDIQKNSLVCTKRDGVQQENKAIFFRFGKPLICYISPGKNCEILKNYIIGPIWGKLDEKNRRLV